MDFTIEVNAAFFFWTCSFDSLLVSDAFSFLCHTPFSAFVFLLLMFLVFLLRSMACELHLVHLDFERMNEWGYYDIPFTHTMKGLHIYYMQVFELAQPSHLLDARRKLLFTALLHLLENMTRFNLYTCLTRQTLTFVVLMPSRSREYCCLVVS